MCMSIVVLSNLSLVFGFVIFILLGVGSSSSYLLICCCYVVDLKLSLITWPFPNSIGWIILMNCQCPLKTCLVKKSCL